MMVFQGTVNMNRSLQRLIQNHSTAQVTLAISMTIMCLSVGITLVDSWFFSHPLFPTIYLAVLVPFIVAPPTTYILVQLIRQLEDTERRLSEELESHHHTNRDLRNSEEKQRQFSADVAHELRTPLAVMKLHLDALEDKNTSKVLLRDVDSMSHLVDQILTLAQMNMLEINVNNEVDLHAVCTNVASRLAPLAIKEKRSIEVVGHGGPVVMLGNLDMLERMLSNLVENAIKYSSRNTTVTVKVDKDAKLSVIDHGKGIPVEVRDQVFDRFLRSDLRSGGTGLGLSIVKQIVDRHKGTIEISETPGGGATVTIHFQ